MTTPNYLFEVIAYNNDVIHSEEVYCSNSAQVFAIQNKFENIAIKMGAKGVMSTPINRPAGPLKGAAAFSL